MAVVVRPFETADADEVRRLFVRVNRLLAPPELSAAFETYIAESLREEIDRIERYYAERQGGFWVAAESAAVVGMFGLERAGDDAMELRRMYVAPECRRTGIARRMLALAEEESRHRGCARLVLSTSALQDAALSLYRSAGYRLEREEIAEAASNKTIGGGIRRFHLAKRL